MGRRGYPAEFRRRVLDLLHAGRSVASIAHDLQISDQTIYASHRPVQRPSERLRAPKSIARSVAHTGPADRRENKTRHRGGSWDFKTGHNVRS